MNQAGLLGNRSIGGLCVIPAERRRPHYSARSRLFIEMGKKTDSKKVAASSCDGFRRRSETSDRYHLYGDSAEGIRLPFDPRAAKQRADAVLRAYFASRSPEDA